MRRASSAVWPGRPYPLGASWDGQGVNFALFSEHAEAVDLCLFSANGRRELERIRLPERSAQVWHCYLPEARPGLLYGYRVHGPYAPREGHRFNPAKLLLDPYARVLRGSLRWSDAHFGYRVGGSREDLTPDRRDNASGLPKAMVMDPAFTWGDDRPPATAWNDTVIYELHVKGFTERHPELPPQLRGTYTGLASEPVVEYLQRLGVTAVELLPSHAFIDDRRLVDLELRNYWGYNTLAFFAPETRYAAYDDPVAEFKSMVRTLHSAGIEVILDVVYNHTCEGNHLGPTLSFRGIDNVAYYRLIQEDRRFCMDFTGCGNTLDLRHPRVQQLVLDSLRYWVEEMHVDGFRFDLATALARGDFAYEKQGAFLNAVHQDPVLSRVKLIAEPWDLREGGYQVGNFPVGWAEWNGKYRDVVRDYWRGEGGLIGDLAQRLSGSSDLFAEGGRGPIASVNFITAHDGFTLNDLVTYEQKQNQANGENNRDGETHNRAWNCGVEGPTDDPVVNNVRARQRRNLLATLLFSQGVPMLTAGDEVGRTQQGNNNAYCQDNELSWLDWEHDEAGRELLAFVQRLLRIRREHPLLHRRRFFRGIAVDDQSEVKDVHWLDPGGTELSGDQWHHSFARCLGMFMSGRGVEEPDQRGRPMSDKDFLLLLNAHHEAIHFVLPDYDGGDWSLELDTDHDRPCEGTVAPGDAYEIAGRSLVLLSRQGARR